MSSNLIFRQATETDIPVFLTFFKTSIPVLFPQYSPNSVAYEVDVDYSPEFLTRKLKSGDKKAYLAFDNDRVVGYIMVMDSIAGVAFADWLAVDKQYQKQGVASKLLSLWEQDALAQGAHALQLWTTENNLTFYKNRGFVNGGLFPKAWHGEDCYLIYRALREPEEKNFLKSYLEMTKKG
jgi:ribosomal protein S18 acetylase RimI-like enzyme